MGCLGFSDGGLFEDNDGGPEDVAIIEEAGHDGWLMPNPWTDSEVWFRDRETAHILHRWSLVEKPDGSIAGRTRSGREYPFSDKWRPVISGGRIEGRPVPPGWIVTDTMAPRTTEWFATRDEAIKCASSISKFTECRIIDRTLA